MSGGSQMWPDHTRAEGRSRYLAVALDVLLYTAVHATTTLLYTFGKPVERGFYCGDTTIHYPYVGNTVTRGHLMGLGLCIPAVVFSTIEYIVYTKRKHSRRRIHMLVYPLINIFGLLTFGASVTFMLTEIAKLSTGMLRPDFLHVCVPHLTKYNCSEGYIKDVVCLNGEFSQFQLQDERKSFPSGHASFSSFLAIYIMGYLEMRIVSDFSLFLKPCLQCAIVGMALFCSVSRISDNRHHWGDVLAGACLGVVIGFWVTIRLKKLLDPLPVNTGDDPKEAVYNNSTRKNKPEFREENGLKTVEIC